MIAFVLAGGRSQRMGADKARIPFPGSDPMALAVADALSIVGAVGIVRTTPDPWPLRVIVEPSHPEPHPLRGVATALAHASGPFAMIAPCDLPWLSPDDVARLFAAAPSVAIHQGRRHPLLIAAPADQWRRAEVLAASGAPAAAFSEGFSEIEVCAASVREVNRWEDTGRDCGPIERLVRRLAWTDAHRVAAGERSRLAQRGAFDPTWHTRP
jgi:molybdopterin-guanine dinucleotide biosynthesis protein A